MLAFESFGPDRKRAPAAFQIVDAAGVGIDLGRDDVDVGVLLVVMGDEKRLRVLHAERLQGIARRQLPSASASASRRASRQAIDARSPFAELAFGALIERVKLHDAPRQVRIGLGAHGEAEILAADPGDTAPIVGAAFLSSPLFGSRPAPKT